MWSNAELTNCKGEMASLSFLDRSNDRREPECLVHEMNTNPVIFTGSETELYFILDCSEHVKVIPWVA